VTAAPELEHGPVDRAPAAGLRAELQVASVASGLLLLLDAHRLTGRLPLEIQVQVGRLRHAVKVAIQAQAGRPIPMPGPAGVDPAAALRAWIAVQPWAQPGPQGWVYLLCFRDPATGQHRPLHGQGCRGQYAGHYWGRPASSALLHPRLRAASRELVATGRRRGLSAPRRPPRKTRTGSAAPTGSW
jgi:hypothetical protein